MTNEELKKEAYEFLKDNFIMNLAFTNGDKPSATVLLFYVDEELNFYFATHRNNYKTQTILENPKVSLNVWEHKTMMIQADGIAEEVEGKEKQLDIIDKLAESADKGEDFWPPLFRIGGDDYIIFKIKPTWMRKLDLVQDTITQVGSPFTEIKL